MLSYDYKVVARYSPTYKPDDMEEKIKEYNNYLFYTKIAPKTNIPKILL